MSRECPFCFIDSERDRILRRGEHTFVMLSNPRLVPGHLLVIPNRHVQRISELRGEEKLELWGVVEEFQERILGRFAAGCDIRSNFRPFIPDGRVKVSHLHFHLQPREHEDELWRRSQRYELEIFTDLSKDERARFINLLGNDSCL